MAHSGRKRKRNNVLVDRWSFVHFLTSAALTVLIGPWSTFIITLLWEPLEIFVISPLVAKIGIAFGYESLRNSLSDIFFNSLGILGAILMSSF